MYASVSAILNPCENDFVVAYVHGVWLFFLWSLKSLLLDKMGALLRRVLQNCFGFHRGW